MLSKGYYSSIDDMPLKNWRKCSEDQDHTYTRKDREKGSAKEDKKAWIIIYDSFLKEFGLGKDYERILELTKEIAIAELEYVEEGVEFMRNRINQLRAELQELLDKPVENDMDAVIIHIENWRKIEIDEERMTVRKFYKLLKEHKKYADEMRKQSKKK